jgi:putative transposon-encoded protein
MPGLFFFGKARATAEFRKCRWLNGSYHFRKGFAVPTERKQKNNKYPAAMIAEGKVKFEVWGEEMIEKRVRLSGNSGRVYLPPDWVDHQVKIIRVD